MFDFILILFAYVVQVTTEPNFVNQLITILTPILSAAALWVVAKLKSVQGLTGFIINTLFVPLCSGLVVFITNLLATPTIAWWEQLIYGLVSAWVAQVLIQWEKRNADKKAGGFSVTKVQ